VNELDTSRVYRLFYPAVPVIIASSFKGTTSAMPAVSAVPVSDIPPLVGFSTLKTHSTYDTIEASGAFSLSWLDRSHVREVELLGSKSGRATRDKLTSVGLRHSRGRVLNVPIIDAAKANLECSVVKTETLGDHEFVVGEVKAAYADADFSEYWQFKRYTPILYAGSPNKFRTYVP